MRTSKITTEITWHCDVCGCVVGCLTVAGHGEDDDGCDTDQVLAHQAGLPAEDLTVASGHRLWCCGGCHALIFARSGKQPAGAVELPY